jgi:hypothetical protein
MTKKAKTPKSKKERPGVQLVLRVPAPLKELLRQEARRCGLSMNAMACARIATGKWLSRSTERIATGKRPKAKES